MITLTVQRDAAGTVCAFTAVNHGAGEVCAAVSLLVLNTVNSIEALTDEPFTCDYREDGGFIRFTLTRAPEGTLGGSAALLLEAMCLGLRSVRDRYENEVEIIEI